MGILHSNFYKALSTGSVDHGESCCSLHFVVLLLFSPSSTEEKKKKISKNEDEADFCTFTSGRRQNLRFQCKNTAYKNIYSRKFQLNYP